MAGARSAARPGPVTAGVRLGLTVIAGLVTACSWTSGGQAGGASPSTAGKPAAVRACRPRSAVPRFSVTDPYDREVLAQAPAMYLTMGHALSGAEPDLSGHGHAGTYLPAGPPPAAAALPNGDQAAEFDGTSQYLQVASASPLSVTDTGCLSVQAWIRPATLQFPDQEGSGYVYILGKGAPGQQEYALRMYSLTNTETPSRPNRISAYVFNLGGGKGSGAYFQDQLQTGTWMMITFVLDDQPSAAWPQGYVAIYQNDQLRDQVSISQFGVTPQSSSAPLRAGTRQLESYFEGAIGKVAVFDYALSARQVQAIYNAMQDAHPQ